ncbi:helix-turn-helix domain-containing protein [Acidithiobacillus ferriphilus]|uniref:helix-turn-helix domain-containing protein n=1 Tax=Acidithiobacillus ferriphilus TaxID=1689834 RepID=UPI0002187DF8|nr:helix-turn-helix transcriptional regulator [Acidithiobacillus ferriphilus]EGQ62412.1 hypothetical protein GGI1_12767 [Acidithiobacillus sp. GGI-221]WCE94358.1 helix-turn-helix transcriptional regulator [Acidithiobacillus ferriphilus]
MVNDKRFPGAMTTAMIDPGVRNAKMRRVLMSAIKEHIAHAGLSQSGAARIFGVAQPRVSDLARGRIERFSLDALVSMADKAGLRVELRVGCPSGRMGKAS